MMQRLCMAALLSTLLAACASNKPPVDDAANSQQPVVTNPSDAQTGQVTTPALTPEQMQAQEKAQLAEKSIYFEFDSNAIQSQYQSSVEAHAAYLKKYNAQAQIQGNTDARGSREYNLALGQRRAESVKQALEVLGVPDKQLEAISYGKEKPRALGNTEADYAENRRADVVYK